MSPVAPDAQVFAASLVGAVHVSLVGKLRFGHLRDGQLLLHVYMSFWWSLGERKISLSPVRSGRKRP